MRKFYLLLGIITSLLFLSCSDDSYIDELPESSQQTTPPGQTITKRGTIEGLSYSLDNVLINPALVVLNEDNVIFENDNISDGIIKITPVQKDIIEKIEPEAILYVNHKSAAAIRKVINIIDNGDNSFSITTEQAHLGEALEGGDITLSLDLAERSRVLKDRSPRLKSSQYGLNYIHEILDIDGTYNWGGFEYNPATNVKMLLNIGLSFKKGQILPSQFSTVFEIQLNVNPSLTFAGSYNNVYGDDLVKYLPQQLIEFLKAQEFDIDIPINVLGIESLPAKLSIKDINIPTEIDANLSKESNFSYTVNGSFKVGYIMNIKGFKATHTPIYENNITTTNPSTLSLNGELLTKSEIVITPNISFLNDAYNVSGDIKFGVETVSNGHIQLPGKQPVFGSKGVFTSGMNVIVDLILVKVPIQIFNSEQELWNEGVIDKTITYSNLKWNVTSQNTTNVLAGTRLYTTDFILNYKYPILGKRIPEKLYISYDVYQNNGTTRLVSVKDAIITPANVTDNQFAFKVNIPYKKDGGIFSTKYQTTSFIKNIVIKDDKGYVYEGILNSSTGIVENSFEIKR